MNFNENYLYQMVAKNSIFPQTVKEKWIFIKETEMKGRSVSLAKPITQVGTAC